jgi:hypothetical protein
MIKSLSAVNEQIECIDTNNNGDHAVDSVCFFTETDPAVVIWEKQNLILSNFITGIIATKITTNTVSIRREKINKEVVVISDAFK